MRLILTLISSFALAATSAAQVAGAAEVFMTSLPRPESLPPVTERTFCSLIRADNALLLSYKTCIGCL